MKTVVQWVIQNNLTNQNDLNAVRKACRDIGINCVEVKVVPFSEMLPAFDIQPGNIYYGSTTFCSLLYDNEQTRPGMFFNPETFSIENYIARWGKHMLNYEAQITTFWELMNSGYDSGKLLFIRPNDDSKSFAGEVKKYGEIAEWFDRLASLDSINLSANSKIVVSEPYNIQYEWRLWIVEKKVVAASKYREYFELTKQRGCPAEVAAFAEERCREYTPHDVFVMDICLCGDAFYIVECGCINGAGFYAADINAIVSNVSAYFNRHCLI